VVCAAGDVLATFMVTYFGIIFLCKHCLLTHCGRVTQICIFNTVNLGTSAGSP